MNLSADKIAAQAYTGLNSLREEYGGLVDILTGILPPSEDFDALITACEDAMDSGEYDGLI